MPETGQETVVASDPVQRIRELEQELKNATAREEMLMELAFGSLKVSPGEADEWILDTINKAAPLLEAELICFGRVMPGGTLFVRRITTGPRELPVDLQQQTFPAVERVPMLDFLTKAEPVLLARVEDLTVDFGPERSIMENLGCVGLHLLPVRYEKRVLGFLAVADTKDDRSPEKRKILLLKILAHIILGLLMRIEAEQSIIQEQRHFRSLVESLADGLILVDRQCVIQEVNDTACRDLGYTRAELLAMSISDIEVEVDVHQVMLKVAELGENEWLAITGCHRRKNGEAFPVEVRISRFLLGEQFLGLCLVRNITQRRALEEKQEQLIQELQAAMERVKQLRGLLPICANCKKIRDDQGYWHKVEHYIREHSEADFTHGLCPECGQVLYGQDGADGAGDHSAIEE